ncbi:TonB-dependent receptor [Maricurvus nonylphenolicus]|uniref:TonB-dependent receptor n=1 Tax=Maricurvus nonylphenolicus TaxID=1008307 RepID=UPI0036F22972
MRYKLTLLASAIIGLSGQVSAEDLLLEEVVVTATKRATTLQEVPIAVSVTSGETIEQAQIRDIGDLQSVVPSLRVEQRANAAAANFIIRGFGNGDNNPGIESSVAVFVDGVYRSRSASAISDLPNIERIEVLRGPQSTLFGKNASAGVISIVTKAPQYEFGGSAEISYGNYNSTVAKGNITGPITDNIAYSLSANVNQRDGYMDVVNLDKESNDRDRWDVRGDLLFEPTEDLSIRMIADFGKIEDVCCGGSNLVSDPGLETILTGLAGGAPYASEDPFSYDLYQTIISENDIENKGISIQVDYELGDYALTSITSYRETDAFQNDDRDFSAADLINSKGEHTQIETFTQEFRLTSNFDGPVNFLLGAYIFDEQVEFDTSLTYGTQFRSYADLLIQGLTGGTQDLDAVETALGPLGVASGDLFEHSTGYTNETYELDNFAISFFGTVDIDLNDTTTLTAGFNYTKDEKEYELGIESNEVFSELDLTGNPLTALQFLPPFLGVSNAVEDGEVDDDEWTWTLRLAHDLTENTNVYASWATGFKAASVNMTRDSRPFIEDQAALTAAGLNLTNLTYGTRFAAPEKSEVFEIGLKTSFDKGSINLAIFDQTIEDFQSNTFTGTGFALSNAGEQNTIGVEFEGMYRPVEPLDLFLSVTWLDPEYKEYEGSPFGDLSGAEPANISEFSVSVGGTYTHVFGDGMELIARADYVYESEVNLRDGYLEAPEYTNELTREVKELNGSVTWILTNGFEFSLWGRNILDEEYLVAAFDGVAQNGTISGYANQPRTYGGSLRFKF